MKKKFSLTVLVTGGSGLVGTAIDRITKSEKYSHINIVSISSRVCDLRDIDQTYNLFKRESPSYVIHLAARVGGLFRNMKEKVEMLEDNIIINMNVLRMCHKFNVKKCVVCLSTCIFPNNIRYPIDESMLHNGPPHSSNDAYAYAKRMCEVQCRAYREQYGCNFVSVIPTNIYGPGDNYNLDDGHVIPALIHKCYLAKQHGVTFDIAGTGSPLRQFIYSDDLATLILWVLENYDDVEPIILSPPEESEVRIKDVAKYISKEFDYEDNMKITGIGYDGQYKKTACNKKLEKLIGEFRFTCIPEGIRKSVDWFIKNYDVARK
jgi:GDP-L-fucose synthase